MKIAIDIVPSGYFVTTTGMLGFSDQYMQETLCLPAQVSLVLITKIVVSRQSELPIKKIVDALGSAVLRLRDCEIAGTC